MYSYSKTIAVTNRGLCKGDYLKQIEKIAALSPKAVILREKDLSDQQYEELAKEVIQITEKYQVNLILHSHVRVTEKLKYPNIHLPLPLLQNVAIEKNDFKQIGVSIHSVEEALLAQSLGATYLTAGHIFETDCKKGVKPRGLDFLQEIISTVDIPVYAIGGINKENSALALKKGAAGVCMMSMFMKM